jgi:hypothetical protein
MKTQKGNRRKGTVAGARLAYDALPKPKHATLHKKGTSWTDAVKKARKSLGITGFVAIKKGTPLYRKAKSMMKK